MAYSNQHLLYLGTLIDQHLSSPNHDYLSLIQNQINDNSPDYTILADTLGSYLSALPPDQHPHILNLAYNTPLHQILPLINSNTPWITILAKWRTLIEQ